MLRSEARFIRDALESSLAEFEALEGELSYFVSECPDRLLSALEIINREMESLSEDSAS